MLKLPSRFLVALLFSLYLGSPASADLLGWLAGSTVDKAMSELNEMAAQRIQQVLDGFDKTSHSLLAEGAHDGNLLMVQGGNEMQLVVASARAQFGSEMDHQLASASADLLPFLVQLERFQLSVDDLKKNAVDMEDLVALDLQDLPFSKSYFGIRRVQGSVMVQNGSDNFRVVLRGPHFGTASADEHISFDVTLNGMKLKGPELGVAPDDAIFMIPADSLANYFEEKSLVTLPMLVTITRDTPKFLWVFGGSHDVIQQSFDVSLMPDYAGDLVVTTTRPVLSWKAILAQEEQDKSVVGPDSFSFTVANGALLSAPRVGEQKVSDEIGSLCHADMRAARKFPNQRVVFADDPIFTGGWSTDKYIGANETDWDEATAEIQRTWGFSWSTWGNNACGSLNSKMHCHVPPQVMIDNSVETTMDHTGCHLTALSAPQWTNNHTSVRVDVTGGTPTFPAPWSLTFQALSLVQDGTSDDPVQHVPVFASKSTTIDVLRAENTTSAVTFVRSVGKPVPGVLGKDVPGGLTIIDQPAIGDIRRYTYSFHYPSTVD